MRNIIGKPWAAPCDPPRSFDCWELCKYVRHMSYGLNTPSLVDREDIKPKHRSYLKNPPSNWYKLPTPLLGCIARIGETHVGVYIGRGQVIHAQLKRGVKIDKLEHMVDEVTWWECKT